MEKELKYLRTRFAESERPREPFSAGPKVQRQKFGVIQNLLGKVDVLIIGGAMAYTFLKAQGE